MNQNSQENTIPSRRNQRTIGLILTLMIVITAGIILIPGKSYDYSGSFPESFPDFYTEKLAESEHLQARPGNEERFIDQGKVTEFTFLYIHGFGASRAEGEFIMEQLAEDLDANVYFLRLPGHGTNKEDHARATFQDYLDTSIQALHAVQHTGERTIVVGTSMGGLISTYLAARYPEQVDALILASPFYDFADPKAFILKAPGGTRLMALISGEVRQTGSSTNDENTEAAEIDSSHFWYREQYWSALQSLVNLKAYVARDEIFARVEAPSLMLYYYKDEENQDKTAAVSSMLESFAKFGTASDPHPLNRAVAIEDGSHVLFSKWVDTDKELIYAEIRDFIDKL